MRPNNRTEFGCTHRFRVRTWVLIFLVAFLVRGTILFSGMTPQRWIYPDTINEGGRVALSLHETGRYADPYLVPSGPTAHPLPLNTFLVALLYKTFGFTLAAGYARCLLHVTIYCTMYALMPWLGERLGLRRRAGLIGGLAGALIPYQGSEEVVGWTSNEPLTAIALGLLLVALVRRWKAGHATSANSLCIGLGFGIALHLAPALLSVWLGCLAFEAWSTRRSRSRLGPALIVLGIVLACAPWTLRNYVAFGEWFFIRSNFGLELRMGNHEGATAEEAAMNHREGRAQRHPVVNQGEARLVAELGEMEYMRQARQEALGWVGSRPAEFLRLAAARFLHVWFGPRHSPGVAVFITVLTVLAAMGARRVFPGMSRAQRAAVLLPLALFPLVYYVVPYMPRYRVPIDWILLMLAGAECGHWLDRARDGRSVEKP
ncbi:MAG: hypothetical protein V1790_09495 [Planctomycetota bacterium]